MPDNTKIGTDILSAAAMRASVQALLLDPQHIPADQADLIELGLDSLHIMRLMAQWRQAGADVTFAQLIENPTLAAWQELVAGCRLSTKQEPTPAPPAAAPDAPFDLTDMQHAYWIGRRDDQPLGGVGCHAYLELDRHGVDPTRLGRAWDRLLASHGMLRARFDAEGHQRVEDAPCPACRLITHDWRGLDAAAVDIALADIRARLSHRRLDVAAGHVAGLELCRLPGGATRLCLDIDLLVADVQSLRIILRDLAMAYRADADPPAQAGWHFGTYLANDAIRRADALEAGRLYWAERLADLPRGPALPLATSPASIGKPHFTRRTHLLSPAAWQGLKRLAGQHRLTPAMVLATAYAETLARWSATSQFLLNLPLFDRDLTDPACAEVVADFTSLLPLLVDCGQPLGFATRAQTIQAQLRRDLEHAAYPGVRVLRDLARQRPGERDFAPVVFACNLGQPLLTPACQESLGRLGWMISQTPQVWLDHQVYEQDDGLLLAWDSVDALFPPGLIAAMFGAYTALIDLLAADPGAWERPVPDLLPAPQAQIRAGVNATQVPFRPRPLHGDFFHNALVAPDRPALLNGPESLTYAALAGRALRVAGWLQAQGLVAGEAVAVTLPRGADQIAAVLGVLAAGGCYVPVGINQPAARQARIHATAGIRLVLRAGEMADALAHAPLSAPMPVAPDAAAYVIFTSGSTGEPKGVEITHRAALNTIDDINRRGGVGPGDRMLAVSALDFDLSVYDIFGLLGAGGALVLLAEAERRDAARWLRLMRDHGVTLWNSVPILLDMALVAAAAEGEGLGLRLALVSGDWVGLDLPDRLAAATGDGCRLLALGGATEAAIWSNLWEVKRPLPAHWTSIPYGVPLANQCYRVADALGRDCPDWVPGELWIGGDGLASFYRGDPALTAARFVNHRGRSWYRTGDMGRYWPDGTLEFLGRIDHQVKVRGHRIELGEVEAALQAHPLVRHAVAAAIGKPPALAAALVLAPDAPADILADIRAELAQRLPDYMVPGLLLPLSELPLSANGKVDRKAVAALLAASTGGTPVQGAAPAGPVEQAVAAIWTEILNRPHIGRQDDFFLLGGDSLLATRAVALLRQRGLGADEPLRRLFAHPVLADFAAGLTRRTDAPVARITPDLANRHEPFPLTEVQQAYRMGQVSGLPLGCATSYVLELDGQDVDLPRLETAFNLLIQRHEMLRACLDEQGQQRILPDVPPLRIAVSDIGPVDADSAHAALKNGWQTYQQDRTQWPLFTLQAVRYGGGRCRLGLLIDYLLLDGFSVKLLLAELVAAFRDPARLPPPPALSFRDYVQQVRPDPATLARDEAYWRGRLDNLPPAPALPLAADPASINPVRFTRRALRLGRAPWAALREKARVAGVTPSVLLLAAYGDILSRWCGGAAMTLNLTLFDRQPVHGDINRVLGDFTSLAPVALHPGEGGLLSLARQAQDQVAAILEHRSVSSIWVQRERARRVGLTAAALPVVFTSTLGLADNLFDDLPAGFPGALGDGFSETPQVWLDHQVYELAGELLLTWDSVDTLFPPGLTDAMFTAYGNLLTWLAGPAGGLESPLPDLLPPAQRADRNSANATARPQPERLLHQGFFDQALAEPSRPALYEGDRVVDYATLRDRSLRLAALLQQQGVAVGEPVAVSLPRGVAQVVGVLGVLAAGGCYVPISPEQPAERSTRIHATAGIRHTVTLETLAASASLPPLAAPLAVSPHGPAYIIFTSGSTGEPKGVEITHHSACNTIDDINRRHGVTGDDRVLALSALDFDLSVYDLFGLLQVGGGIVLVDQDQRREPAHWLGLIRRHGVTLWNSVPVLLDMLLTAAEGQRETTLPLRVALLSGDWIGTGLPARLAAVTGNTCAFSAMGGATEGAIWSNLYPVTGPLPAGWTSIPYGWPLANQQYRVVDALGRDCPDWVEGELWIGGAGVATGYRGATDLTRDRFVQADGRRWYRTGDRGRYRPSGLLEFLGRRDQQVKLRGHRIELGEVEAALARQPGVKQAVALLAGSPPGLAAFIVSAEGIPPPDEATLRAGLAGLLPDYMIPSRYLPLAALPLSANGKLDRNALKRLAEQAANADAGGDDTPLPGLEQAIAGIWQAVLGCARVGRQDDFFQLGGDSLRATQIMEQLARQHITRQAPPLRLLFTTPQLAAFAAALQAHDGPEADFETGEL